MAATIAPSIPGSVVVCPASSTITSSAAGHTACEVLRAGDALEVVLPVDEHTGYRRERNGVAQQHAVCEEHVVVEVMRAETSAASWNDGSSHRAGRRALGSTDAVDQSQSVQSPAARADRGIRILEEPAVRGDEIAIAFGRRDAGAESSPRVGKEWSDVSVEPVDLGPLTRRDADQHHGPRPGR